MLRSTDSGVSACPVRSTASISPISVSTMPTSSGEPVTVISLPRAMDVGGGEGVLDQAQVLVAGAEQRHHRLRVRDDDRRLRPRRTSGAGSVSVIRHSRAYQPGGQARPRPPSTWKWTWWTDWPGALAGVGDDAVAGIGDALLRRRPVRRPRAAGRPGAGSAAGEVGGVGVVRARDDEDVHGRLGRDVAEGDDLVVAVDDVGGDVAGDDRAEQAVAHAVILPRRPSAGVAATRQRRRRRPSPADDVRRTDGPSRTRRAPGRSKASSSAAVMPPSGPTTMHDLARRRAARRSPMRRRSPPRAARGRAAAARTRSATTSAVDARPRDDREPGPAGLLRRGLRGVDPAPPRTVRAVAAPLRHAVGGRPRHDLVDTDLGQQLDGQLAAIALGQRLHDDEARLRVGLVRRRPSTSTSSGPCRPRDATAGALGARRPSTSAPPRRRRAGAR